MLLTAMGNLPMLLLVILGVHIATTAAQQEVIVAIDDPDKTQYHEANFNTSAYQFGYEVGPNGQFHHETRGPDGVTYGCYGYIDPNGMLRVTHYVADSHGYRVVEPNRPVEIFSDSPAQYSNALTEDEPSTRHRGQLVAWRDLYLPRGCGMYPGGLRPDGPAVTPAPPPPTGVGFTVGAGISQAGISGSLTTSHNSTSHTGATSLGGSIGTGGVHATTSQNSTGSVLGVSYNHTSSNSGSLTGQGVQGTHTGSNSLNSTHVSVSGANNLGGSLQGGQITVGGTINHTETLAVGSVNVSSTSGGTFGGAISPEHIGVEVSGMLTTNASISAPLIGPQQGSVTVGGGGSVDIGRPPQGPSTDYPYGPTSPAPPPSGFTTTQPDYPSTASGVQPPNRPGQTGPPPSNGGNNNNNQYPPYQIAVSQYPYFFVPYPYPPSQAPCNCPQDQNRPPTGYLGFIPVIYVPSCSAQKSGLPTHINWPAPPPPNGLGKALEELPLQRLVQGSDGSWNIEQLSPEERQQQLQQLQLAPLQQPQQVPQPRLRQNRNRRLRSRRPPPPPPSQVEQFVIKPESQNESV